MRTLRPPLARCDAQAEAGAPRDGTGAHRECLPAQIAPRFPPEQNSAPRSSAPLAGSDTPGMNAAANRTTPPMRNATAMRAI